MRSMISAPRPRSRRGFTLPELLVVTFILTFVGAGMLRVFFQAMTIYHYELGKNMVNRDFRWLTTEFSENASAANACLIYATTEALTRSSQIYTTAGRPESGYYWPLVNPQTGQPPVPSQSGNVLVLVYRDPAAPGRISRIVVYYQSLPSTANPPATAALQKLERRFEPSSTQPVEKLIPTLGGGYALAGLKTIELTSNRIAGPLFHNVLNRSCIVQCEVRRPGGMAKTRNATATNTYSFVVFPRG